MSFNDLFPIDSFGERRVVIMDGGMGTTLGSPPFSEGLDSTLWSSELLQTDEGKAKLMLLNETWIKYGAEIVGSCTYQSALPLFLSATSPSNTSITKDQALNTMLAAIPIVTSPYSTSTCSHSKFTPRSSTPFSSLSLGPLGAQLAPGQEYSGLYPPPYGPTPNISPSIFSYTKEAIEATSSTSSDFKSSGNLIEDALTSFHLTRLFQFSSSEDWGKVSLIAFETIPNLIEARAIRRAMYLFNTLPFHATTSIKPFYISYVFPVPPESSQARYPDASYAHLPSQDLIDLIISTTFSEEVEYCRPDGIGVNCTNPLQIEGLVKGLSGSLKTFEGDEKEGERPWLVLYPDGGSVYDVVTRTWSNPDGMNEKKWASILAESVSLALDYKMVTKNGQKVGKEEFLYGGIFVGGCCKAGPGAIRELRKECIDQGWIRN